MLEHEKKNRVTKSKVEKMMRQIENYRPPPPDDETIEEKGIDSVQDLGSFAVLPRDPQPFVRSQEVSVKETSQSGMHPVISGAGFSFVTPVNVVSPASTIDQQEPRPPAERDSKAGMYATMTNFANPRLSA